MFKLYLNKKSIVLTWVISYTIVLMLPVFISYITYLKASDLFESQANDYNFSLLKLIQQRSDDLLLSVHRLSAQVMFNAHIKEITDYETINRYDIEKSGGTYEFINELTSYKEANRFIDNVYVYFKNIDAIISPLGSYSNDKFFDLYCKDNGITNDEWALITGMKNDGYYLILPHISKSNNYSIAFVKTMPIFHQKNSYVNVIIIIDAIKLIENDINVDTFNKGTVFVTDSYNNIITSTRETDNFTAINFSELDDSTLVHRKINGEDVAISDINSEVNDWKYVMITPVKVFQSQAIRFSKYVMISLLISLIIGGFFIARFIKKNYNPVSELIGTLKKYTGSNINSKYNEFHYIFNTVEQALEERNKVKGILHSQEESIKKMYITKLLKGTQEHRIRIEDMLDSFNIKLISDYFAVMQINIEDIDEIFFENATNKDSVENLKLTKFIIDNVFEELINKDSLGFMVEINDTLVCMINIKQDNIYNSKEWLIKIASEAQEFIEKHFNIYLSISISNCHETVHGIPQAYQEAQAGIEYRIVMQKEGTVHYSDIKKPTRGNYNYSLETEQKLINCIKAADYERAKAIVDSVFIENCEKHTLPIPIIRCLMFDIISTMIKTFDEINSVDVMFKLNNFNPVKRLLRCDTIAKLKLEIDTILKEFCDILHKSSRGNSSYLVEKAVDYIEKNYSNVNLNVGNIADYLNLHPNYVSRIFKLLKGEGLLDYINNVRINHAKEIMKLKVNEYKSSEEISLSVGYSNIRTFNRVFLKIVGTSPAKYREVYNNESY